MPNVHDSVYGVFNFGSNAYPEPEIGAVRGYVGVSTKEGAPRRAVSRSNSGSGPRLPVAISRLVLKLLPVFEEMMVRNSPMPRRLYAIAYPPRITDLPLSPKIFLSKLFRIFGLHAKPKLGAKLLLSAS